MTDTRTKIFIGSSKESLQIARAIQHGLLDIATPELWNQGLFRAGTVVLNDLLKAVDGFDFGVFVFAPDDVVKMREKEHSAVRDNVLFELGIFIGRLGPERSIFVVPKSDTDLHLPSDLTGIIPATYDGEYISKRMQLQVAVSPAVFQISEVIREKGPAAGRSKVLFDSRERSASRLLQGKESYIYKDKKRIGEKAAGSLNIGADGLITIGRSNHSGRYEIHLRPQGPRHPSFTRTAEPLRRPLRVTCKVRAEGGSCKIRFVAKDEAKDKWLASEGRSIEPGDWVPLQFYLWVDPTRDFLFRIDEEELEQSPSKLLLQDLTITDEST
jgi:hypothetical protein